MSRISALYDTYLRKAPRQSRSRSVVEAVLSAASERLSRSGDEADVTIQDIADRAGVGIGSLYDYFRDRPSVLAAVAAKLTEDNLVAFQAVLAKTHALPLTDACGLLVDFCFETYLANKRGSRAILKITHAVGMMPALAQSQTVFAESMADALRKRADVTVPDVDVAAWNVTQAMMGMVQTMTWQDDPPHPQEAVRADAVRLFSRHLGA